MRIPPPQFDGYNPEVRYGESREETVLIAAAFAGDTTNPVKSLIQFEELNRAWLVALSLEFMNPADGVAGDTMHADFVIQYGVGSSRITNFRNLNITQAAALTFINIVDVILQLPGEAIAVSARLRYVSVAGAARTMRGKVIAMASPLTRSEMSFE
jgi:hypothetical protein